MDNIVAFRRRTVAEIQKDPSLQNVGKILARYADHSSELPHILAAWRKHTKPFPNSEPQKALDAIDEMLFEAGSAGISASRCYPKLDSLLSRQLARNLAPSPLVNRLIEPLHQLEESLYSEGTVSTLLVRARHVGELIAEAPTGEIIHGILAHTFSNFPEILALVNEAFAVHENSPNSRAAVIGKLGDFFALCLATTICDSWSVGGLREVKHPGISFTFLEPIDPSGMRTLTTEAMQSIIEWVQKDRYQFGAYRSDQIRRATIYERALALDMTPDPNLYRDLGISIDKMADHFMLATGRSVCMDADFLNFDSDSASQMAVLYHLCSFSMDWDAVRSCIWLGYDHGLALATAEQLAIAGFVDAADTITALALYFLSEDTSKHAISSYQKLLSICERFGARLERTAEIVASAPSRCLSTPLKSIQLTNLSHLLPETSRKDPAKLTIHVSHPDWEIDELDGLRPETIARVEEYRSTRRRLLSSVKPSSHDIAILVHDLFALFESVVNDAIPPPTDGYSAMMGIVERIRQLLESQSISNDDFHAVKRAAKKRNPVVHGENYQKGFVRKPDLLAIESDLLWSGVLRKIDDIARRNN